MQRVKLLSPVQSIVDLLNSISRAPATKVSSQIAKILKIYFFAVDFLGQVLEPRITTHIFACLGDCGAKLGGAFLAQRLAAGDFVMPCLELLDTLKFQFG